MQDHKIGKQCQIKECRQIDWMPMGCKYCHGTFCYNHYSLENHNCKEIEKEFKKVIQCPFCLKMVKNNPALSPEETLSIHQATQCKKVPQQTQVICSSERCKTKITQINKFVCTKCDQTVCMKHRLPANHTCQNPVKRKWMNFVSA